MENDVFPDTLRTAIVTLTLERIMYTSLYKYLTTNKLLFSKQFGFQTALLTKDTIPKLADQIYESFEKNHSTLGVFLYLSEGFDTIDHIILIKKFGMYGVKCIILA